MGEDRSGRQGTERMQPLERTGVAAGASVLDVGPVLGDVHVQDRAELAAELAGLADRVVRHRERGVQPDATAHQWAAVLGDEPPALGEAAPRFLAPPLRSVAP